MATATDTPNQVLGPNLDLVRYVADLADAGETYLVFAVAGGVGRRGVTLGLAEYFERVGLRVSLVLDQRTSASSEPLPLPRQYLHLADVVRTVDGEPADWIAVDRIPIASVQQFELVA